MIDWTSVFSTGSPVVLALLFAWFALQLFDKFNASQLQRDENFLAEQSRRDSAWREFLTAERDSRKEGMTRLAEELKANTLATERTGQKVDDHDRRFGEAVAAMREARSQTRRPPAGKNSV